MLSFFGRRRSRPQDEEEALLPQYEDATVLQRKLHAKLHSYQMIRALVRGYLPSNEQLIANLRSLLAADFLAPHNDQLSDSGQAVVHYSRQLLVQLIELLRHKNSDDQIQDFAWHLFCAAKAAPSPQRIVERAATARQQASPAAAYQALQTVASLLLANSDFRLFLSDVTTLARDVFKDTAFALSDASRDAGHRLQPDPDVREALKQPGRDEAVMPSPDGPLSQLPTAEASEVLRDGTAHVVAEAQRSVAAKLDRPEKDSLLWRLKQALVKLRRRPDYEQSVSTLSILFSRWAATYSTVAREVLQSPEERELEDVLRNFWLVVKSFGDASEWAGLEAKWDCVMDHGRTQPGFDQLLSHVSEALVSMLRDPDFFDRAGNQLDRLRAKIGQFITESSLREDVDALLDQALAAGRSVCQDTQVTKLKETCQSLMALVAPARGQTTSDLLNDSINVFVPHLVSAIQYIPIPRLELAAPQADLLLENLVLEPGVTVNHTSFLPYKMRIETHNDLEVRKARFRTTSAVRTLVQIHLDGISVRAEEVGFWLRAHCGLFRFVHEGIASFSLDERGVDIELDVQVRAGALEKVLTLRRVRVHIHRLEWTLQKSAFSPLAWLLRPLLRPVVCRIVETRIATAIAQALHVANREIVFARERLRATRVADPDDLLTFLRAVMARLSPSDDPDVHTRVGVTEPGQGVFKDIYTPGSIVKLWNDEAAQATQRVRESERGGWRNSIFDIHGTSLL